MSFKTKTAIKLGFIFAVGIVLIGMGLLRNSMFISMGTAMVIIGAVMAVKWTLIFKNPEKAESFENSCKDERLAFINQKSYAMTFWLSIVAEFIGVCVMLFMEINSLATYLNSIICVQAVIYAISYLYFSRKY